MAKTEHSKLPLRKSKKSFNAVSIFDNDGLSIATVWETRESDRAGLFIKAVNNHYKLVEALEKAIERLGFAPYDIPRIHEVMEQGLKALKQVEEG